MPGTHVTVKRAITLGHKVAELLREKGLVDFARQFPQRLAAQRRSITLVSGRLGAPYLTTRYQLWQKAHPLSAADLDRQRIDAQQFRSRPLISIMTPVFNPPPDVLRTAIESVRAQTYDMWELCLADGASDRAGVRELLEEYARLDPRIRVCHLERNLGISGNSNEAARMATGEFLMIFDHDDLLAPNALFEIASTVNTHPDADLIYYDEDMISADGARRFHPLMKPEWSPEMLLSANYLMHCVVRRDLFWSVGGFNPDFDGAQDWDLEFRCIERTSNIVHVPRVLYHWRAVTGSAAASFNAKPYVFERQRRCISDHLQRRGIAEATATFVRRGFLRVSWPTRGSKVSLIMSRLDGELPAKEPLETLLAATVYPNLEIVLVAASKNNRASAHERDDLSSDGRIRVVEHDGECDGIAARNLGAQHATGEILLFLDDSAQPLDPDWLEEMVRWAEQPEIGVVGAKLLDRYCRIRDAGLVLGLGGAVGHIFRGAHEREGGPFANVDWYRNCTAVSGVCQMMRRDVFERAGGYRDEDSAEPGGVDLCLRVLALGYRNLYTPYARLAYQPSRVNRQTTAERAGRNHHTVASSFPAEDRYYNPNLSRKDLIPNL